MSAVATKPRAARTRPAPQAKAFELTTQVQRAFAAIGIALVAACGTDEPHDWSGDSDRLLRIAADIAQREAERDHGDREAENYGYDIAALIKAARLVPGDTESLKRTALLDAVEANLFVLTEDADCMKLGATRAASPNAQTASAEPAAIAFDSSAMDIIEARTFEIAALSSCAMCLSAVEAAQEHFAGHELATDAIPTLNHVIRRLSQEAAAAGTQLWQQFQQARATANGKEYTP